MWDVRVFDTITGGYLFTVEAEDAFWSTRLSGTGTGTVEVALRAQGFTGSFSRDLFAVNARMVGIVHQDTGVVMSAGFITDVLWNRTRGVLTVNYADIRGLLAQRMGFGVGSWGPSGSLTVTGRDRDGAVRAIVYRAMRDGAEPLWELPIDLPADGAGGFTRTWHYYSFPTMDDCLSELEDEGVEIWFDPYLDGADLRFATRVGKPYVTGLAFDLPVHPEQSAVSDFKVAGDGARQLTGVIHAGNGTDADQVTAWAGGGPYTIPIRDAYRSSKSIKSATQLQRIADNDFAEHQYPVVQWSFSVQLDDEVIPARVRLGRVLRMDVRRDEWVADGEYLQRVIGVSGDLSGKVTPEVQVYGG